MGDILDFKAKTPEEKASRAEAMLHPNDYLKDSNQRYLAQLYDNALDVTVEDLTAKVVECEQRVSDFVAGYIKEQGDMCILLGIINYIDNLPLDSSAIYDIILRKHISDQIIKGVEVNDNAKDKR